MVRVRLAKLEEVQAKAGLRDEALAAAANISLSMLGKARRGEAVGGKTISGLRLAFPEVAYDELFEDVPDADAA